jgi:hypothetical protein
MPKGKIETPANDKANVKEVSKGDGNKGQIQSPIYVGTGGK